MGFSTKYLGRLDIEPHLNESEVEWLRAYAAIDRRHYTERYEVAMNPRAVALQRWRREEAGEEAGEAVAPDPDPFTSLTPLDGSPYPHLDWEPCVQGCCLVWEGTEKSRMAEDWLQYLIDHFLRPGAHARTDHRPDFKDFTFDHVVSGIIAAERDDTRELFLIVCEDNTIRRETLVAPDVMPWDLPSWGRE
jgi:hypothetical protein